MGATPSLERGPQGELSVMTSGPAQTPAHPPISGPRTPLFPIAVIDQFNHQLAATILPHPPFHASLHCRQPPSLLRTCWEAEKTSAIMTFRGVSTLKFVGTVSLGLLTVSYLSSLSLPSASWDAWVAIRGDEPRRMIWIANWVLEMHITASAALGAMLLERFLLSWADPGKHFINIRGMSLMPS